MSDSRSDPKTQARMLPALLKHYRRARGLSQLDLASAAEVSPRHLSFLETGRAKPSREMVARIGATLGLSLRDQNALLCAAGFSESYRETEVAEMPAHIRRALERMMQVHEPFPLVVFDANYDVRMLNRGASALMRVFVPKPSKPLNLLELSFDPNGLRPYVENWEQTASHLLQRLSREHLQTGRESLAILLSRLLAYPDVPGSMRTLDLTSAIEPVFDVRFRVGGQSFGFLTTLTCFNAPQDVTLDELRIESYFPLDDATARLCEQMAQNS
ncbi:MAG TPA: helix-turn-helix domain-containing protein [Polyangiales bacterium]|nr:helix-turn-helix domain-containing protein [Polyangiales bacterium]